MQKTNSDRLEEVATALQDLNESLVYVGGAMVGVYATDPAATEPRVTTDVDCVVNSTSYSEHAAFEELLRKHHFQHDMTDHAPICRWIYNGDTVDVMSMDEKSQSFGNRWYRPGFYNREAFTLPSGISIYRLPVTYYVATKIEALISRGGDDWRGAKDFEDIIYVLNYCLEFLDEFRSAAKDLQSYLSSVSENMLQRPNINEEIECVLPNDEIERTAMILDILQQMASFCSHRLRIQFVSDLHLEFSQNRQFLKEHPLEVVGDILLVAGDTAYLDYPDTGIDTFSDYIFWDWASKHYKQVIVCLGNHDFYGYYDLQEMPEHFCKTIRHNVHAYYNETVHFEDVDIIVTTLWSKIEPQDAFVTQRRVSDFYRIMFNKHLMTADDFNQEHKRCLSFIKNAVAESKAKTKIVLSHHVPTQLCTAKEFRGSIINGAFTVELGDYIADTDIAYWIYGHSHRNISARIGNTSIVSNQLGYVGHGEHLQNGFNPGAFIEL